MSEQGRLPEFTFDYGQPGDLTKALLEEAQEVLAMNGKSQRALVERVRALHHNRGADSTFKQVLRIVQDYLKVYPLSFDDMARVLGGVDQAVKHLPGCEPPEIVWVTLQRLQDEKTPDSMRQDFWMSILDSMENGEEDPWVYISTCHLWTYTYRGNKPGYYKKNLPGTSLVRRTA